MTTKFTASMTSASTTPAVTVARRTWRKIGAAFSEMNYAAARVAMPGVPVPAGRRASDGTGLIPRG